MRPTHASFHLYRAMAPVDLAEIPKHDDSLFTGVFVDLAGNVTRPRVGELLAVVAGHPDERSAREAVLHSPIVDAGGAEFVEQWHVAAEVVSHRGETNWDHQLWEGTGGEPGAPLIVMTTAGYVVDESFDFDRANDFVTRTRHTQGEFAGLASNSLAEVFYGQPAGPDGITLSVWTGARAMVSAAYRSGVHAENLALHREQPMFDRSSFTRARPIFSAGTWRGVDPLVAV